MKLFRKRRTDGPVGPEDRSPQLGIKHKDLLVLKQLIDHGADITAPRHVLHYLYFAQEESARQAAREVAAPFSSDVRTPEAGDKWLVVCEAHNHTLSPETVRGVSDFFESLAGRHGGQHDGWEASV